MNKSKITLILILILLLGNFFFSVKYFSILKESRQTETLLEAQKTNDKVLEFAQFFIKEVLKANKEVSFETRLKLENMVRSLGDKEILAQWSKFTESKTESSAQEEVKNLLEILVEKVKVQ